MMNMKELMAIVGRNIVYFMDRDDAVYRTANALGLAAGISPNTIRYYIDPKKRPEYLRVKKPDSAPELDKLLVVAEKLGCEVWELLHPDIEQARKEHEAIKAMQAIAQPEKSHIPGALRLTTPLTRPQRRRDKRHG